MDDNDTESSFFINMDYINQEIGRAKEADPLNSVSEEINVSYLWVLFAIGCPGNILTITTVVTMGKISPATFFVALLAVYDTLALITKLVGHVMIEHYVYVGDVGCKMRFIPVYLSTVANWILVLIALERFISVCYPLKKAHLLTKKRSYIIACVLCITFFIFFLIIFEIMYTADSSGRNCGTPVEYSYFWRNVWRWITPTLFLFIPFALDALLVTVIIIGLQMSRRSRRSILRKDDSVANNYESCNQRLIRETERMERMITIMLITACVVFLLLALPACVFEIAYDPRHDDSSMEARWQLFKQVKDLLLMANHAANFFFYSLSSKKFRNHLLSLVMCKWQRKSKRREATGTNLTTITHLSNSTSRL